MRCRVRCDPFLSITFVEGAVEQAFLEGGQSATALGRVLGEQNIKQSQQLGHFFGERVDMPLCRMLSWWRLLCMWQVKWIEGVHGPRGKTQALPLEQVGEPHIFSFNVDNKCLVSDPVVFCLVLPSSMIEKMGPN